MKSFTQVNRAPVAKKTNLLNKLLNGMKKGLSKSQVGTKSRELAGNPRPLRYLCATLALPLRYVAMIFAVLTLSIANIGTAWADTEIYSQTFTSWSSESISAGGSSHSIYFKSATTVTNGTGVVFGGNGSTSQHFMSIPLENVNGSITVTITSTNAKHQYNYSIETGTSAVANKTTAPSMSTSTKDGSNTTTHTFTISSLTASHHYARLYIAPKSSDDRTVKAISITTPAAASTWYVKGGWNSWGTTDNFKGSGTEVSATVNITTAGLYEFKIWNNSGGDGTWYGNTGNIGCNVSGWEFATGKDNCKFFASETGNYTFTFNTSTKALSVTYPSSQGKYYYKNTGSWGAVAVYRFKGGINNGWPGTQVVETETICGDTYYFTYADPGTTLIFNNNGGGSQTGNMAASGNAGKYVSGTGSGWTAFTYNVTYDKNGGTGTAPTDATNYSSGASVPVKDNSNLTKSGYYFAGWNTKADGSGDTYVLGQTFSITSCTTLYAKWNAVSCPDGSVEGTVFSLTSPTGTVSVPATSSVIITSSQATITNGMATMINGQGSAKNIISSDKINFGHNNTVLRLNLGCALAAGDVISFTSANYKLMVSKTNSTSPGANNFVVQPSKTENCTIPAGSNLIGLKEVYVIRAEGSTTTFTSLTITRPAGCDAPSALAKSSVTAKGVTLTVTDDNDINNYEFYVSTSSTEPAANATATHTVTSNKSKTITDCVAGTTYYAWARTKCSASNKSDWVALGSGGTFTTSTVTMTPTLTNVTHTSGATSGIGGSNYTAVFTANTGYSMPNPTVTIGGNAATSGTHYTWSVDGSVGTITIPANKINGNIAITLNSAKAAPSSVSIDGTWHPFPGETITLTATPTGGNGPKTYQWYKGGTAVGNAIDGATSATYTKASCAYGDAGDYYCKVTCAGTETTTSSVFQVKILRLYVKTGRNGTDYGNVDFVKVDGSTATASISLGSNWDYGFNVADGVGHYYGNSGTMNEGNCTGWTMDNTSSDCLMRTTNAATYIFTVDYSTITAPVVSITYPSGNQASGKVIYFDNQTVKWSNLYYRIGRTTHTAATAMTKVPGTNNLYKVTTSEYNNFTGWHIGNNCGGTGDDFSIYCTTTSGYELTYATAHEGAAVTASAISVTPTTNGGYGSDVGVNDNCQFYNYSLTTGMKTDNVAISPYSNGTITVNYTNTSGSAATLTSGNADLAHSVILTSITAVADEGYDASAITINGGAYSANYVVTGNTTIAASFTLKTYTISYNKGTNGTGSKASETKTHGVNFTLPGSTFTYGGHAQDGWSTSDGGALAYALSGSYTTNAAQEFFPHWKCNTPTITDNGDNTVSITVPSGTTVRYTTDGTDPSSSTGTVYSTTFSIAADCTVKAIAYQSNCTDSEIASQACDYTAPANFQMIANSSAASDATLANKESISQGSKNCATLTGGTAVYSNADGDSKSMTVKKPNNSGNKYGWYFNATKDVITITLTSHIIKTGTVISITGYASSGNGVKINGYDSYLVNAGSEGNFTTNYTVLSTDANLLGTNVLTLAKKGSTYVYSLTISNCQAATPCTTPTLPSLSNQAGCSYTAWNATPSNKSTIDAAGESITYSWKKGATEKATTASYTPDADGTDYTVTVTVSKAGKITTSVTSSALSATKYGNPTVTGPSSDAEYEVGDVATNLSVTATPDHGESLTYQWYSNTAKSTTTPTPTALENCTTSTYKPSTAAAATTYYFCKVSGGCADVYSSIATVTVNEASCFKVSDATKKSMSDSRPSGTVITDAMINGTITGGTLTYMSRSGGTISGNSSKGLIFDNINDTLVVQLAEGHVFGAGGTITITSCGASASTYGFTVSGNSMTPASLSSGTDVGSGSQSYTITAGDGIAGRSKFNIVRVSTSSINTYLYTIKVTGCEDCNEITPSLSYSKSTFWMDDAALTATPTLTGYYGTPTISYASSDPTVVRVDNSSTGAITALKRGTATITATIGATTYSATDYCGNTATCEITVKDVSCGEVVLASATRKSGSGSVMENGTGAYYSASGINSETSGKLGSNGHYMYITLTGTTLQDGDVVVINLNTVGGIGDRAIHLFAGTTSGSTEIGTKASPGTGDNEITLSNVPNNTYSVTMYRTSDNQNHKVDGIKVKRYVCPDSKEFLPTASSGNWNATANWIGSDGRGASLPTIDDRVVISKPVTVDIADAKAKDVLVNQYSGATGKITVSAGKALIIAEKMQKTTTGSNRIATAAADVIINSDRSSAGVGALVIGGETGSNQATVNFETKVKKDDGWVNQFIGSPFSDLTPYVDYALQIYRFVPQANGDHGWWTKLKSGDEMEEFWGHNVLYNDKSELTVNWTGTLNASTTKTISSLYYVSNPTDNMFANSWTAPIHVGAIEDADIVNAQKVLYVFNAGTPEQENATSITEGNTEPGTYVSIPIHSAPYAGLGVIPSMQAFYVEATAAGASITLDYNKVIYTPALTSVGIVPNRAPKRTNAVNEPEVIKLRVQSESGWAANTYVMGREDFAEDYEDGWDGAYIEGESATPKLYSLSAGGDMFINCLPEIEGTVVAFRKGNGDSQYTFSFEYAGEEDYYLKDLKLDIETPIDGEHSYAFTAEAGDNAARFIIVRKTPTITTGTAGIESEISGARKVIYNNKVYIIRGGSIYSVDGQVIK